MCGINGIITKFEEPDILEIKKMNSVIRHRGPDDEGVLKYKNVLLGHVRLSIQDLSTKGRQPMSTDNRYWIIFNGEIYNFKEIRSDLEKIGYNFFSNTDTEVIINSYKEWGEDCFVKFNGMWSLAILDKKEDKIIICRDRYGVKPCYIALTNKKIIFSSEIKGVFASNENFSIDQNKTFNNDQIKETYFTTGFKDIDIVQPGHIYTIDISKPILTKKRWWYSLSSLPYIAPTYNKIKEDVRHKLINATKLRLTADAKIATSLSGGIDSSIIFSILNSFDQTSNINLNPFIINYQGNHTFEAAKKFSKSKDKEPVIVNIKTNKKLNDTDSIKDILSSLEINDFFLKQVELYKAQKENGFKVSIDGHGADESHGGYTRNITHFAIQFQNSLFKSFNAIHKMKNTETLLKLIQNNNLLKLNKEILINKKKSLLLAQKTKNQYIEQDKFLELPTSLISDLNDLQNFGYGFQSLYLDSQYGFLQWLLNKWDKASMSSSIEIRSPFLDWNFFQYSLAIPIEFKIQSHLNKSILRDAFANDLSDEINETHLKQGLNSEQINSNVQIDRLITDSINNEDFKNHSVWNGKKIIKDFNNNEKKISCVGDIWQITKLYLQEKGFKEKSENVNFTHNKIEEQFNLLN